MRARVFAYYGVDDEDNDDDVGSRCVSYGIILLEGYLSFLGWTTMRMKMLTVGLGGATLCENDIVCAVKWYLQSQYFG